METYQAQCEDSVMGSIAPTWDLEQRIGPQQNRRMDGHAEGKQRGARCSPQPRLITVLGTRMCVYVYVCASHVCGYICLSPSFIAIYLIGLE